MAEVELLEDRTQLTPMTYAATGLPLPVGDPGSPGTMVSTISVADDFVVQDVNVRLNIEHTWDSDLQVVLIAPDGTRVELFSGIGFDNDNFIDTVLDQQADLLIVDASATFTGVFQPSVDLSLLNGQLAQGDWQLEITDVFLPADSGTLLSWTLTLDGTTDSSIVALRSTPDAILEPTLTPGVYSLTVARTGALSILLSAADERRFAGDVALLTPDLRPLVERAFPDESGVEPVTLSEYVDSGVYLLRVRSSTAAGAARLIQAQIVPASNPGHRSFTGNEPQTVQVVDVNDDGHLDLVTPNAGSNDVSVLLGRGDGTFEEERRFAVGSGPQTVQAVDVNGDGCLDLITPNLGIFSDELFRYVGGDDVSVLLGRGDGTFENQRRFAVGSSPRTVQVVDVNGDGRLDLVTPNSGSDDVSLLLGNGDGTFEVQTSFVVGVGPLTVQVVDVDGDGHLDLVTPNAGIIDSTLILVEYVGGDDVSVLLGNGDGTFEEQRRFAVGVDPRMVQAVDVNSDGRLDLVTPNSYSDSVSVLLGNGDGTFEDQTSFYAGYFPESVQVVDLNGDGHVDLVTPNSFDVSVLLGRGDGTFDAQTSFNVRERPETVQAVDVNGDGRVDLVAPNFISGVVSVLLGRGDGTFEAQTSFKVGVGPQMVQVADVNGDRRVDLVTPNSGSADVSVLLGNGDGTFAIQPSFKVGNRPVTVQVVDVNGDGRVDVVTPNLVSADLSVLLGNGDGTFEVQNSFNVGNGPFSVQVVDVNGDGRVDLVAPNAYLASASVLLGNGNGTFAVQTSFNVGLVPQSVQMVEVNGDGHVDLVTPNAGSDDVSVLLGNGDGTFEEQRRFAVGNEPQTVQVVDVNGDRRLDLVIVNAGRFDETLQGYVDSSVSVLLSLGGGGFEEQRRFTVGNGSQLVEVFDVNGDRHVDLVVPNSNSDDVSVLLGHGDGTFSDQQRFDVGDNPCSVQVADVNGDGLLDLVAPNKSSDDVSVLLGNGDGTFEILSSFNVGNGPITVKVLDVNVDGRLDLVTPNIFSDDVSVLLGNGDGTFEVQTSFNIGNGPFTVQVADVNGDGRVDLVTPNYGSADVSVLLGNGQGDFVNALSVALIAVGARPVVEDISGDGIDDVLLLRQDGAVLYRQGTRASLNGTGESVATSLGKFGTAVVLNPEHPARDFTLLRSPSGLQIATLDVSGSAVSLHQFDASATLAQESFQLTGSVPISGSIPGRIASGNFDRDSAGRDDFALINQGTQTVTLYFADAMGFHPRETFEAGAGPVSLTTTDLNRDGLTDLIVPNFGSGDVSVFTNSEDGHFETSLFRTGPGPYYLGPSPYDPSRLESQSFDQTSSAEIGDFNGDGLPDVIATNPGSNSWSILFGTTQGLSSDPAVTLLGNSPSRFAAVRVADVNHDGHDDAVFLNESGTQLSVYLNSAEMSGRLSLQMTRTIDLPTPLTGFILHDADGDARPDVFATNEFGDLLLLLNRGEGRFEEDRQGQQSIPIAVQDLDGDGKLDVVLANQGLDAVKINYGRNNDPTALEDFAARESGVVAPGAVKLADLDGDRVADLIVPNTGGNSVLIYRGRGDGTFGTGETIFTGSNPASVTVSDLDGDQRLDLIVTNRGSNTVAVFYGQAAVDEQTIDGTNALPFRAGALSRLPSGSGPVDAQVVSLPNADGSMQTGLVVTNSTSDSVSFIPSAGNGIFNATPSNEVPLGFSPLPGAIVNGTLVLPNPGGDNLGMLTLSASLFGNSQPPISFASGLFDSPIGIDGSADLNGDGLFDLLVANNGDGSVSLLLGDGNSFEFSSSFFLEGITRASDLQVAGFELYVTEEGQEFFTVFDLADLGLGPIPSFEEISGNSVNTAGETNPPITGIGGLSGALLLALFGTLSPKEGEANAEEIANADPASWQSFVRIVSQVTKQVDRITDEWLGSLTDTLGMNWSHARQVAGGSGTEDRFLTGAAPETPGLGTLDIWLTPLGLLTGTQPLTQLVRSLRSLLPNRTSLPTNRPADSSTSPATKTPLKNSEKPGAGQSSAVSRHGPGANGTHFTRIGDRSDFKTVAALARVRASVVKTRVLANAATEVPAASALPLSRVSAIGSGPAVVAVLPAEGVELTDYLSALATNPTVANELFDRSWPTASDGVCSSTDEAASLHGWRAFAWSAMLSPALAEFVPRRLRNRRSRNMMVG